MNITQWYAISIAVVAVCIAIHRLAGIISVLLKTRIQFMLLKHLVYPMFLNRKYWGGVTRFHGSLIGSYIVLNGFCMGLGIRSTTDLLLRSGTMASINLIPLFLGGRTNMLSDFMGISLHSYYLAHHWIGRIVILQSLIHVGLVIRAKTPWTFDSFQIAGITVSEGITPQI
tara:strand:+ start:1270 stop:1782 length:513 start_codon:yes stop_codon:yes gene_type:complete